MHQITVMDNHLTFCLAVTQSCFVCVQHTTLVNKMYFYYLTLFNNCIYWHFFHSLVMFVCYVSFQKVVGELSREVLQHQRNSYLYLFIP